MKLFHYAKKQKFFQKREDRFFTLYFYYKLTFIALWLIIMLIMFAFALRLFEKIWKIKWCVFPGYILTVDREEIVKTDKKVLT